ncbi:MAG: cysteine--tRNA ligase [Elusimicrobia bacterium]|nr:cysteine--tRNA ligase [Elusimicrobiota bacterium]
MGLKLFNTLTRQKEDFRPLAPPIVGLYTCGPTVYNYLHVGNWRTYIFEDILKRALGFFDYKVRHVMNITDVGHLTSQADEGEDKMEVGAAREGKTAWEIARFYTESFLQGCQELNLLPPDVLCKATDHIKEQIDLVKRLEKKGLIYSTSDGLYFDTAKFPAYGRLAGSEHAVISHVGGLQIGARIEANPEKRSPADFAVWKFSPKDRKRQMEWDSPWGTGFPGWHIECSAMAMRYLGESFDIHCGGVDHIPIHHTNEIAQSEAATEKPFARFWMHGEFLLMNNAKMAKSEGGFVTLSHFKDRGFSPLDLRYHCLTAHYRKQLDFTWEALESSKTARRRLREIALGLAKASPSPTCADDCAAFKESLGDDLNVPVALAALWDGLRRDGVPLGAKLALLEAAESVLALGLFEPRAEELPARERELLDARAKARADKDFALSDELRRELETRGILVEDTRQGQKWRRK